MHRALFPAGYSADAEFEIRYV